MLSKLFKKKNNTPQICSLVGETIVLDHDCTVYQYGSVKINGKHYCVLTEDGSMPIKGTKLIVIEQNGEKLTAKRIKD